MNGHEWRFGSSLGMALCALVLCTACARDKAEEKDKSEAGHAKSAEAEGPSVSHDADGSVVLHVSKEAAQRMGIAVVTASARSVVPETKAYGHIVENTDAAFMLRAPIAGVVRVPNGPNSSAAAWPTVGSELTAGVNIGSIEPRLSAVERADVTARLAAANGDVAATQAALVAAESASKRAQDLNAQDKNVSDRVVQEADALVKTEKAKLDAARSTAQTLQALLAPGATANASLPLVAARAGEVVEVLAKPGENVDAGAPILRIQSFDEVLARIDLPIEGDFDPSGAALSISPFARDDVRLPAQRRALDARVDPATQGRAWLVAIDRPANMSSVAWRSIGLRPGQAIVASLPRALPPLAGFVVPSGAVVRHAGKAWIWVQSTDETFVRRGLDAAEPASSAGDGWFTSAAWAKDAHVVSVGAQALLSTELIASQKGGAEEP